MNFAEVMATFIGHNVECFQEGQFLTGQLIGVSNTTLTVEVNQSIYSPISGEAQIVVPNIDFVRILP